jgi:protein-S-isoprenylcysteine O-methyltransferase Ste14
VALIRSTTISIARIAAGYRDELIRNQSGRSNGGTPHPPTLTFVCAGTIHFWQGWLTWLSFLASSIAIGIYLMKRDPALLERRMRFGPQAESRSRQKIIIAISLVMFVALAIVPGLDHRFGWSRVPATIVVIANMLMIGIFGFFLLVLRENTFAASTITVEAGQRVISTGPYALVRHPMYAGGALLIFGMPIAMASWWGCFRPRSRPRF